MSIIQDALKKAQDGKKEIVETYEPAAQSLPKTPQRLTPEHKNQYPPAALDKRIMVAGTLILLALGVIFLLRPKDTVGTALLDTADEKISEEAASVKSDASEDKLQDVQDAATPAVATAQALNRAKIPAVNSNEILPELTLNGIMFRQPNPRALINDQVVEVGDTISGAEVTSITRTKVFLQLNGKTIELKMR